MLERERKITDYLDGVENYFLTETNKDADKLLRKVREIVYLVCPKGSDLSVTVRVPSQTLVDLGLVSERAAAEIDKRTLRKKVNLQDDELINRMTLERCGEERKDIKITKTYISQEEGAEGGLRKDTVVSEQIILTDEGMEMDRWPASIHLHGLDQRWIPANSTVVGEPKRVMPTERDLNRTLALLVEGLKPGYLVERGKFPTPGVE